MSDKKADLDRRMREHFEELRAALSPLHKEILMGFVISLNKELEERAFQRAMDLHEKRYQEKQSKRLLEILKESSLSDTTEDDNTPN